MNVERRDPLEPTSSRTIASEHVHIGRRQESIKPGPTTTADVKYIGLRQVLGTPTYVTTSPMLAKRTPQPLQVVDPPIRPSGVVEDGQFYEMDDGVVDFSNPQPMPRDANPPPPPPPPVPRAVPRGGTSDPDIMPRVEASCDKDSVECGIGLCCGPGYTCLARESRQLCHALGGNDRVQPSMPHPASFFGSSTTGLMTVQVTKTSDVPMPDATSVSATATTDISSPVVPHHRAHILPAGGIAGIVVGVAVIVALIAVLSLGYKKGKLSGCPCGHRCGKKAAVLPYTDDGGSEVGFVREVTKI
ncbi:MAG: hypothetical protein M1828_002703 [Chrysothrix sp. TS-e1954]|nr:MAG: hypothetical protein M1828_002703 [Chrysothrix sp. TS-e1954]